MVAMPAGRANILVTSPVGLFNIASSNLFDLGALSPVISINAAENYVL